ncbi:MAG: DUF2867 domain-containing protein [Burkholderiaceae bacterium]|nr:DUF2867 domain-containing protein [Burkholderiaceae bacterium]
MNAPINSSAPTNSKIESLLAGAYFHDAWAISAAMPDLDALGQFLRVASTTPKWIDRLMKLRNRLVGLVGLKDLGGISGIDRSRLSSDYRPGERVGIFTLIENTEKEALLGDDDKHLNVVVSVHKALDPHTGDTIVTVTTVVHVKNWLGRIYMLPVAPAHRVIARTMVKAVGNAA